MVLCADCTKLIFNFFRVFFLILLHYYEICIKRLTGRNIFPFGKKMAVVYIFRHDERGHGEKSVHNIEWCFAYRRRSIIYRLILKMCFMCYMLWLWLHKANTVKSSRLFWIHSPVIKMIIEIMSVKIFKICQMVFCTQSNKVF